MPLTSELKISPSTPQTAVSGTPICFEGSGIAYITASPAEHALDIPASGTNWTYNSSTRIFTKTGGGNPEIIRADTVSTVYGLQPFHLTACNSDFTVPASPNRNVAWAIGVTSAEGDQWYIEVVKNCNDVASGECDVITGSNWLMSVRYDPVGGASDTVTLFSRTVNFNELFTIRSDGRLLNFDRKTANVPNTEYSIELPITTAWTYWVGAGYVGNKVLCVSTFEGSYGGTVPVEWTAPLGGSLVVTGNTACLTATTGDRRICLNYVEASLGDPICVDVTVSPLFFEPVDGLPLCVFTGEIVHFESNGGLAGVLTAVDIDDEPIGTVIDALTWQAPGSPVPLGVTLTYTLGGDSANAVIFVINQLELLNVEGDTITGMVPGEAFQIVTNYEQPYGIVTWENVDCPNVVSGSGLVSIPGRLFDECFGALDCRIRGKLTNTGDAICPNITGPDGVYIDVRVIVDPVYPTPLYGGPLPLKWKPETPDYRVIENEFEGGCDETYIRNRIGTYRWSVRYGGLPYTSEHRCDGTPCCDDVQGFINGYDKSYHTAKRLDDFWNLVTGTGGYFTLFDYRTGEAWRRARFTGTMERDHIHWVHSHSRELNILWRPCCATGPLGGSCVHQTVLYDTFPPSIPQNPAIIPNGPNQLIMTWNPSSDNVGVKGYDLIIGGGEEPTITVDNVTTYVFLTTLLDPMDFRVRAFDHSGNTSEYSEVAEYIP